MLVLTQVPLGAAVLRAVGIWPEKREVFINMATGILIIDEHVFSRGVGARSS